MKKKKLLSVILASALAVSVMPFQAFASQVTPGTTVGGTIGGDSTIASSAIIRGVVPKDFNFVINPLELNVPGSGNAQIISTPYTFQNMSNMDVQLSVTPVFVTTDGVTIASSPDEIKNVPGEAPTIFMQVAPATTIPTLGGPAGNLDFVSGSALNFASGDGISMTVSGSSGAANTAYFKLKNLKQAYTTDGTTMTYDPNQNTAANTDAIGFMFTGKVSQLSKWDDPKIKLGVSVEFAFDFISSDSFADTTNVVAGTYQMLKESLVSPTASIDFSSDGKFAFNIPTGYHLGGGLGYFTDTKAITVTKADIKDAIETAWSTEGVTVGSYTINNMEKAKYDWDTKTKKGYLFPAVMSSVSGRHMYLVSFCVSDTDPTDKYAVISSEVVLD